MTTSTGGPAGAAFGARAFVLVQGAWRHAGVWNEVADILRAAGHSVIAPELSGLGDDSSDAMAAGSLTVHIAETLAAIEAAAMTDIVLVGHSYGGVVISGVAELAAPGLIGAIVYLDAILPTDGEDSETPRLGEGVRRIRRKTFILATGAGGTPPDRINALRADPSWRIEEIRCGHMTMLDAPEETAEALLRAA